MGGLYDQFVTETSLGGFQELKQSKSRHEKFFWAMIILLSTTFMSVQVYYVSETFFSVETGKKDVPWVVDKFPPMAFCPKEFADTAALKRDSIDIAVYYFAQGYLPLYELMIRPNNNGSILGQSVVDLEAKLASILDTNQLSIEQFLIKYALKPKDFVVATRYRTQALLKSRLKLAVHWRGLCVVIEPERDNFTTGELVVLQGVYWLNPNVSRYPVLPVEHGFYTGITDRSFQWIDDGTHNQLIVRAVRYKNYNSFLKKLCESNLTVGQYACLQEEFANRPEFCKGHCREFVTGLPPGIGMVCNQYMLHLTGEKDCRTRANSQDVPVDFWYKLCPPPCSKVSYELFKTTTLGHNDIRIRVTLTKVLHSTEVREYPLYSTSQYLSSLGGTISLWFGASVMSLVHVGYFATGAVANMVHSCCPCGFKERDKVGSIVTA